MTWSFLNLLKHELTALHSKWNSTKIGGKNADRTNQTEQFHGHRRTTEKPVRAYPAMRQHATHPPLLLLFNFAFAFVLATITPAIKIHTVGNGDSCIWTCIILNFRFTICQNAPLVAFCLCSCFFRRFAFVWIPILADGVSFIKTLSEMNEIPLKID